MKLIIDVKKLIQIVPSEHDGINGTTPQLRCQHIRCRCKELQHIRWIVSTSRNESN